MSAPYQTNEQQFLTKGISGSTYCGGLKVPVLIRLHWAGTFLEGNEKMGYWFNLDMEEDISAGKKEWVVGEMSSS